MKPTVAFLLILTLVIPASARERTPLEQARNIAQGSKVQVELKTGQIVRGRLGEVTETQFTLEPLNPDTGPNTELLFQDVWMVRSTEPTMKNVLLKPLRVLALIPLIILGFVICGFHTTCDL